MNAKTLKKRIDAILNKAIFGYAGNCWNLDAVQACYAGLEDYDIESAMHALGIGFDHPDSDVLYAAAQDEAKKRAGEPVAQYRDGYGGDDPFWQVFADGSIIERTNAGREPWSDISDYLSHLLNDCGVDEDYELVKFLRFVRDSHHDIIRSHSESSF